MHGIITTLQIFVSPSTCLFKKNLRNKCFIRNYYDFYNKKKEYNGRKLVGFSCDQMYEVVSDIKNYKYFIPFCCKSKVLFEKPDALKAELEIGFPPVVESYISNVTLVKPVLVKAINTDGHLFDHLETTWRFSQGLKSNPQSCIIDFHVSFQFRSLFHSKLAHMFFDKVVKQMEGAFIKEAKRRYGRESLPSYRLSEVRRT